jgi:glycosyltransferase A (GT-A) superfamily protein (DUF2064 family)
MDDVLWKGTKHDLKLISVTELSELRTAHAQNVGVLDVFRLCAATSLARRISCPCKVLDVAGNQLDARSWLRPNTVRPSVGNGAPKRRMKKDRPPLDAFGSSG